MNVYPVGFIFCSVDYQGLHKISECRSTESKIPTVEPKICEKLPQEVSDALPGLGTADVGYSLQVVKGSFEMRWHPVGESKLEGGIGPFPKIRDENPINGL